jgi:manganese-dependent ADP-ribose/CDP-alcohol diphosphatase
MKRFYFTGLLLLCIFHYGCMKPQALQFGIIADVQYADKPQADGRYYRDSLRVLQNAVDSFNSQHLDFVIQLGDLIDGGESAGAELKQAVSVFGQIKTEKYHVLGNHDFLGLDRQTTMRMLNMSNACYSFDIKGRRFIVLDTQEIAVQGGWSEDSPAYQQACQRLEEARAKGLPNAQTYNGSLGPEQLQWLEAALTEAEAEAMPVIVFSHLPLMPPEDKHTAWNADEVVSILEKHPCVKAAISGHNHAGGYTLRSGIHYVTLEGAVDAAARDGAWAVVTLNARMFEIRGFGAATSRSLPSDIDKSNRSGYN